MSRDLLTKIDGWFPEESKEQLISLKDFNRFLFLSGQPHSYETAKNKARFLVDMDFAIPTGSMEVMSRDSTFKIDLVKIRSYLANQKY